MKGQCSNESSENKGELGDGHVEKASIFLKNSQMIMNIIFVEIWKLHIGCCGEVSDENKDSILENGEKVIHLIMWQKTSANLCYCVLWMIELMNKEMVYLPEKIMKQDVEGLAWIFLTAISKI